MSADYRVIVTSPDRVWFRCTRCGACCSSAVQLCESEVSLLEGKYPEISPYIKEVVHYTFLGPRIRYVLMPKRRTVNFAKCIFYDPETRKCRIYSDRPAYCRIFPIYIAVAGRTILADVLWCDGVNFRGEGDEVTGDYVLKLLSEVPNLREYMTLVPNFSGFYPTFSKDIREDILTKYQFMRSVASEITNAIKVESIHDVLAVPAALAVSFEDARVANSNSPNEVAAAFKVWYKVVRDGFEDLLRKLAADVFMKAFLPYRRAQDILDLPDPYRECNVSVRLSAILEDKELDEDASRIAYRYLLDLLYRVSSYYPSMWLTYQDHYLYSVTTHLSLWALYIHAYSKGAERASAHDVLYASYNADMVGLYLVAEFIRHFLL